MVDYKQPGLSKRRKELIREQRQKEKAERKEQRRRDKEAKGDLSGEEDPDIAGIVPGPQPVADE